MEKKNDGGPAFPVSSDAFGSTDASVHGGMSLRDYFAAQVFPEVYRQYAETANRTNQWDPDWRRYLASDAYHIADAMIASRSTP